HGRFVRRPRARVMAGVRPDHGSRPCVATLVCAFRFREMESDTAGNEASMNAALSLQDVHKSFGAAKIINGVSLDIAAGEPHAIIGPNGAGKSTLFNLISGRFPVSSGKILLGEEEITGLKPFQINRKGLSRSFQVTNIFHNLSVYENIRCGLLWPKGYRY